MEFGHAMPCMIRDIASILSNRDMMMMLVVQGPQMHRAAVCLCMEMGRRAKETLNQGREGRNQKIREQGIGVYDCLRCH